MCKLFLKIFLVSSPQFLLFYFWCSRGCTRSILFRTVRQIQCTRYGIAGPITWRFIWFVWQAIFIEDSSDDSNTTCKYTTHTRNNSKLSNNSHSDSRWNEKKSIYVVIAFLLLSLTRIDLKSSFYFLKKTNILTQLFFFLFYIYFYLNVSICFFIHISPLREISVMLL